MEAAEGEFFSVLLKDNQEANRGNTFFKKVFLRKLYWDQYFSFKITVKVDSLL